jgi:HEAT repeat protein/cyclophilin family peptidyl-prolyl cis-trans isomerase
MMNCFRCLCPIPLFIPFLFLFSCSNLSDLPETPTLDWIAALEDQRYEVDKVLTYLDHSSALVRHRTALTLARLGDGKAIPAIIRCLEFETDLRVTEMLIFALGRIGNRDALPLLEVFKTHSRDSIRATTYEALGKLNDPEQTRTLLTCLKEDPSPHVRSEVCLALFRLGTKRTNLSAGLPPELLNERTSALAETMITDKNANVRWRAAYALSEIQDALSAEALKKAMADPNVWVRTFAARGLGFMPLDKEKEGGIQSTLIKYCNDPDWPVVVECIKSLKKYNNLQTAIKLIHLLSPGVTMNTHIRATAARSLGAISNGGDSVIKALRQASFDFALAVEGEAITALGEIGALADDYDFLDRILEHGNPFLRLKAAEGAILMKEDEGLEILFDLAEDKSICVRCKVLEGLKAFPECRDEIIPIAEENLGICDMALHYAAADLLLAFEVREEGAIRLLKNAYAMNEGTETVETRLKLFNTIIALEEKPDPDFLWKALTDEEFSIRDKAAELLSALPGLVVIPERPEFPTSEFPLAGVDYLTGKPNPVAHFFTEKGEFWVELFPDLAPHHVKNFIRMARNREYDKLKFHRVVPNFVVQGLDPRGDGWGRKGILLRDEINRLKFLRGYVGMPNSGPDTGGCQMFITLIPTPHLDDRYTIFGKIISGGVKTDSMQVVSALQVGDRVLRVTIEE